MLRLLNILDEVLTSQDTRWPRTHNPSSASAWLPCEACNGMGFADADYTPCPACSVEHGAPERGRVLVGECMRCSFFKWLHVTPTNPSDATGLLKMGSGNMDEKRILDHIGQRVPLMRQVSVRKRYEGLATEVHGYMDALYFDPEDRCPVIVEAKSTYSRGLADARDGTVKPDHFLQVCLYADMGPETFPGWTFERAKFLYWARDNFDRRELDRVLDAETVATVAAACVARWKELEGYLAGCTGDWWDSPKTTIPVTLAVLEQAREALETPVASVPAIPPAEYRARGTKGDWSHWKCRLGKLRRDGTVDSKTDGYCPYRKLCHDIEEGNDQWRSTSAVPCSPAQG